MRYSHVRTALPVPMTCRDTSVPVHRDTEAGTVKWIYASLLQTVCMYQF